MDKDLQYTNVNDTILNSIADGVFTVDENWRITSFNKAAENIIGISRDEAIGKRCCDIFKASICETSCALRKTLQTGKPIINQVIYIIDSSGEKIPVSISTALLRSGDGKVIGGVETFRDLTQIENLRRELEKKYSFQDIISKNSKMLEIFDILPTISESDSTVLIEGESGTGKELVARAIHDLSSRKDKPIVTINCGALPDSLLEAELFGYKAGAFTGAQRDKPGRFAVADGGTIFLDEIGDISPALQVRLLRVLQEKTYEPLGANESAIADVRIIAASNKNLAALVKAGKFREDLYYRINVIRLVLPPLRDRKEDIPLLVDYFINQLNSLKNKLVTDISPQALTILMNHDYPGNIRELKNIIEHAFVLCQKSIIEIRNLPDYLRPVVQEEEAEVPALGDLEARIILSVLRKNNWNRAKTATELGIHKTTLWRKMKRYGLSSSQEL
jgi:PAS domain S-box-containing protein